MDQKSTARPDTSRLSALLYEAALAEANTHIMMLSSRAQELATQLHEVNQNNELLRQALAEEQLKNVGLSSKLEEVQRIK